MRVMTRLARNICVLVEFGQYKDALDGGEFPASTCFAYSDNSPSCCVELCSLLVVTFSGVHMPVPTVVLDSDLEVWQCEIES